jgi:hypothetical protein
VADCATYANPVALGAGVETVIVNGQVALHDGRESDRRTGRLLRFSA